MAFSPFQSPECLTLIGDNSSGVKTQRLNIAFRASCFHLLTQPVAGKCSPTLSGFLKPPSFIHFMDKMPRRHPLDPDQSEIVVLNFFESNHPLEF